MAATPLSGARVLITGATGGLGRAIARESATRGASLYLVGRDLERIPSDVEGPRMAADLRIPGACTEAVSGAASALGGLDVVINAVGVVAFGPVAELSTDAMEELFLTNTFVPIMLAQAALARIEAGGAIVNISGVIAEQNLPGMAAYGASKGGLRAFDEAFAREARRQKVRVLDARPPHTETGLADRPIEGATPKMPTGLDPAHVARVICDAIESGAADLPSEAFSAG